MLDIERYIELDDVRLVLGTDDIELTDDMLLTRVISTELSRAMSSISGKIPAVDDTARNLLEWHEYINNTQPVPQELERLDELIYLFCVYKVATVACDSLPMFAWVSKADAYASVKRDKGSFSHVCDSVLNKLNEITTDISDAVGISHAASECFYSVRPAIDRITGRPYID